jgi:hypothetical protein
LHDNAYIEDCDDYDATDDNTAQPNEFVTLADIRRIEKGIEAENTRLHPDDGRSIFEWVQKICARGHLLSYKSTSCPIPPDSGLAADTFFLAVQTGCWNGWTVR